MSEAKHGAELTLIQKVEGNKMELFLGTKQVKGVETTKQEYCDYRGWNVPQGEDPDEVIMLVEYEVDPLSKPNHDNHEGYITMSPKHVFEKAYKKSGTPADRVQIELSGLNSNIDALGKFLEKGQPSFISNYQWEMMSTQHLAMNLYTDILNRRHCDMLGTDTPNGVSFGIAIEALRLGKCIARKGWNQKDLFVCKQVTSVIDSTIIPVMHSLPESAKNNLLEKSSEPIMYENQMILVKNTSGTRIINSWVASSSDTFANDWMIVD